VSGGCATCHEGVKRGLTMTREKSWGPKRLHRGGQLRFGIPFAIELRVSISTRCDEYLMETSSDIHARYRAVGEPRVNASPQFRGVARV